MVDTRKFVLLTLMLLVTLLGVSGCQLGRFVFYNFADISDHKKFQNRVVHRDTSHFEFFQTETGRHPKKMIGLDQKEVSFEEFLHQTNTVSFLIIQNDTLQYESYFHHYTDSSIIPSFSISKSVISILIGCAIDDSLISSVEDPITKYLPELEDKNLKKVKIKHLLQMTSGIDFNESYSNPFGDAAAFYYGTNLRKKTLRLTLKETPGTHFEYISGNTQLLAMILESVLASKNVSHYLETKIWKPLNMEFDASWSIDKNDEGIEKAFCCINARARDYAKIGRLYANKGNWNGTQIVSEQWVEQSTKIDTSEASVNYYQYSWWLPSPDGDFIAEGILGQLIYIHPKKNLIIVRMGKNEGSTDWWGMMKSLASSY